MSKYQQLLLLLTGLVTALSFITHGLRQELKEEQEYTSHLLEYIHKFSDPKPNFHKCINSYDLAPKSRFVCEVEDNYQQGHEDGYKLCNSHYLQYNQK